MIIDSFERDADNQIWAICGTDKVQLSAEYIAKHKPQEGDELVQEEPQEEIVVAPEVSPEEPK